MVEPGAKSSFGSPKVHNMLLISGYCRFEIVLLV